MSAKNCPLQIGFLIRIIYEINPFLKSVRWKEVSAIEDVRYKRGFTVVTLFIVGQLDFHVLIK